MIPVIARRPDLACQIQVSVGLVLLAVFVFGPSWVQTPAMVLIVGSGLAALHIGPRRYSHPAGRCPWIMLRTAGYLFVVASVLRMAIPGATDTPPTRAALIPDAFIVGAYLGMGYAFWTMLRQRHAAADDPARIDALLVGLAAAFMAWTFLIVPSMGQADLNGAQAINAFFPIFDVVLMVLVAQLMLVGGARQPAVWLLMLASAAMFGADLLYALRDGMLADVPQHPIDSLYMLMFVLLPAAALAPSMRTLTEPQRVVIRDLSPLRIVGIALLLVVPIVVTSLVHLGSLANDAVRAALCALLILAVLARVVRSNNSQARAERASARRATHDALTDLPNRDLLTDTVTSWGDRAADSQLEISLLFLDLDRFKMVNEHWGHRVGDELLCAVADRLSTQIRAEDLLCRVGGDEFVIALASPSHLRLAESLADRVLAEFAHPFELSVGHVVVSTSIGVAKSDSGAHAVELIRDADTAMYKAKGSGRNAYVLFDNTLRDQVRDRVKLEQALRGALERGELAVHFQPIIDLATDELDGFEALMRWQSPELGHVSPMEFIPIAEETGMIVEMGTWLLRESAHQLRAWIDERGPAARPLHVSVNVAVRQLRGGALVRIVNDVLAEAGLPASALWLEITESGVMEDIETALVTLNALRALGVTLCVDDFGTGYSSLSYLHRLPCRIVKIDRSFVRDVGADGANEPIVRAVLAMTKAIGQSVVAEGVETETQRDWLRVQGCELVQGWFYGKADLPANLGGWIHRRVPVIGG